MSLRAYFADLVPELPLNPLWWLAFIVWGAMTLLCRDWGRIRKWNKR